MATQTSNLGLTKPGYDEAADIVPAVNNNMDTLDAKMGAVPANSSVQGQLDSHSQAIGNLANLTTTEKGSLVGAANELNSKFGNLMNTNTVTKTTSSAADFNVTADDVPANAFICEVFFKDTSNNTTYYGFVFGQYGISRYVKVFKSTNDEPQVNKTFTVTFKYIIV